MNTPAAAPPLHARHRTWWALEVLFLGILGAALLWLAWSDRAPHLSEVQETIVLVIFLGGLLGLTRIPFPQHIFGRPLPLWTYPVIAGLISGVMDSFLVLLLVGLADLAGPVRDHLKFKAYAMIGALIGGLTLYFGEVYMLPLALQYGMRSWHALLPLWVPILVFLGILGWLCSRLDIRVVGMRPLEANGNGHPKKTHADWFDVVEFIAGIALLLTLHDALLCLGVLLAYAWITGQGEDLIDVLKTEMEVGVMILLVIAAFIAGPIEPLLQQYFAGWWAFIPSTINGVLTGAIFPVSGDVWRDTLILSTAVLLTPVSSLVGIMLFKTWADWKAYMRVGIPLAVVWFVLLWAWLAGPWQALEPLFYRTFPTPSMEHVAPHP